jgi:methyltransferase (TIGR00027 family)
VSESGPPLRNISDTAMWAAIYRARESERPDGLFRDRFARRLAGTRGEQIALSMPFSERATWAWVMRTYLFDQYITEQIAQGADLVINLAAGLDARPYRMPLPRALKWIEVDLDEILAYKEPILAKETPVCSLERVALDLSDLEARRQLFERLGRDARKALLLSEGLLLYLTPEEVGTLAQDLATPSSFQRWAVDLASPGLLKILQKNMGKQLSQAGAQPKFGPADGPEFFVPYGWRPVDVRNPLKVAARLNRLSFGMKFAAMLPASNGKQGSRPWSGICLLAKG